MRAKPCVFFALTESRQGCILQSVVAFSFHWISRDDNVESWVGTTFYQHSPASTEPVCKQEAEGRRKPRSSFQYSFVPLRLPFCRLLGCHCTFPIFWFTPNLTFFSFFMVQLPSSCYLWGGWVSDKRSRKQLCGKKSASMALKATTTLFLLY